MGINLNKLILTITHKYEPNQQSVTEYHACYDYIIKHIAVLGFNYFQKGDCVLHSLLT